MTGQPDATRQMHFALMLGGHGGSIGGWRMPQAWYGPEDYSLARRAAELCERAKFDMLFVADVPAAMGERPQQLEALTELSALVGVTKHIGLAATVSTTYSEPYNVARMLASLDHLSGGRSAWNVVTTAYGPAADNFGLAKEVPKADRYEMAAEYVEVVKGLLDSWEDGAVLVDKASGRLMDTGKRHVLDHKGKYYSVKGPLNMSRPPQGYPVILQAGASDLGLPFAAATGEVIFTVQPDAEGSRDFCSQIRELATKAGRDASQISILPGLVPFLADTEAKAREMYEAIAANVEPEPAWAKLSSRMGIDLTGLDPEGPVPEIPPSEMRGHAKTLTKVAKAHGLNLRQLRDYLAVSGHPLTIGTPEMIADIIEQWFRMGACDGFMLIPPYFLQPLQDFTEQVIPILQKRGLFRTEYTGKTLRDHLGLSRPPHPSARQARAA